MAERALHIIGEFLESADADTRRKGTRALGSIHSLAAARRLVDIALTDTDARVRRQAEVAVSGLGDQSAVAEAFREALGVHSREAYALLGRVRQLGADVQLPGSSWRARIRRALAYGHTFRRATGWKYWVRGFPGMFIGLLVGYFMATMMNRVLGTEEATWVWAGVTLLAILAPMAAVWTSPTTLHFDRRAGIVANAISAGLLTLVVMVVGSFIIALGDLETLLDKELMSLIIVSVAMAVTVSLVTGVMSASVTMPVAGYLITMFTAGVAGLIASGLTLWLIAHAFDMELSSIEWWGLCWPLAFGFSAVFASLDRRAAGASELAETNVSAAAASRIRAASSRSYEHRFVVMVMFVIYGTAMVLLWLGRPFVEHVPMGPRIAADIKAGAQERSVDTAPMEFELQVADRGLLAIQLTRNPPQAAVAYVAILYDPGKDAVAGRLNLPVLPPTAPRKMTVTLSAKDDDETSSATVDSGTYRLRVEQRTKSESTISIVESRAKRRLGLTEPPQTNLTMKVILDKPAVAFDRDR